METHIFDAHLEASEGLRRIVGEMTVTFGAKVTQHIKEALDEVLASPQGILLETKQHPFLAEVDRRNRSAEYDATDAALKWLLHDSRSRALTIQKSFGFQVISFPDLINGGLKIKAA